MTSKPPSPPIITSISNPKVKQTQKLRDASARRARGRFLVDGWREIQLALDHGLVAETIFYTGQSIETVASSVAIQQRVSSEVMARLSYGQRGDWPVAVMKTPELPLEQVSIDSSDIVLVLDRTEKPGNLGACLRTASACGVSAVILTNPICEIFNPNTIRSSRGTVFSLPLAQTSVLELAQLCHERKLNVVCARVDGKTSLWNCDFRQGAVIILGNEAQGLGPEWNVPSFSSFHIPMLGSADSLNLSISAAVTLYEAVRQRSEFDR